VCENQEFLFGRFDQLVEESQVDNYWSLLWSHVFGSTFNLVGYSLNCLTNVVFLLALSTGKIDVGEFFAVTSFVLGVIRPLESLGLLSGRVAYVSGAVFAVERVLKKGEEEMAEDDKQTESESKESSDPSDGLTLNNELRFHNVSFRYPNARLKTLRNVSTSIKAGSYVCIMGPSDCGKSTLLSLLEGVHRCTNGQIYMDGVNIDSVSLSQLRGKLGVVFQDTFVLNATIRDNIGFGYHHEEETETNILHIISAAKDAQIHEFIETLPNKYDTMIGLESEISLSGGQLQRICGLARALVRKPSLLILDEATSALDAISENLVIETVERLCSTKGMTAVSVSHHTKTAVNADMIIVLDKGGEVAESGKYNDLVENEGLFCRLVKAGTNSNSVHQ
jgi:ABC-type multidrug transport system fused ATPase/permease subunit